MFLNHIKDFYAKKIIKNSLQNLKTDLIADEVQTVGLLIDATLFTNVQSLIEELVSNGIAEEKITVLQYKDRLKMNERSAPEFFSAKQLNWSGVITSASVNSFINEQFDLLISFYEIEKPVLMLVTHHSKAKFKAGFSSVDKRLNHFMINTTTAEYSVFTEELFRYLKLIKQNSIK